MCSQQKRKSVEALPQKSIRSANAMPTPPVKFPLVHLPRSRYSNHEWDWRPARQLSAMAPQSPSIHPVDSSALKLQNVQTFKLLSKLLRKQEPVNGRYRRFQEVHNLSQITTSLPTFMHNFLTSPLNAPMPIDRIPIETKRRRPWDLLLEESTFQPRSTSTWATTSSP